MRLFPLPPLRRLTAVFGPRAEVGPVRIRLLRASGAFVLVAVVGSVGYHLLPPHMSWFDGLYMTLITVTTIGYGEVVPLAGFPLTRLFTIFVALSGIGILTYMLSNFSALIIESTLSDRARQRQMENRIARLTDHYIICGMGSVGSHIADELRRTHRAFVFVDPNAECVQRARLANPADLGIEGDATADAVLQALGVERAVGLFVATHDDSINLVICVTARQLNPRLRIVAMARTETFGPKLRVVGANHVIAPLRLGALRMASEMVRPTVTTFLDQMMRDESLHLRVEEVQLDARYHGQTLADLDLDTHFPQTILMAIRQGGHWYFKPTASLRFSPDAILLVMTSAEERAALEARIGTPVTPG